MRSPEAELAELEAEHLRRRLRCVETRGGTGAEIFLSSPAHGTDLALINFASNDYLGLATSADLREILASAALEHGAGSGASRLVSGGHGPHFELEKLIAKLKGTEAALAFSSGYAAAVGTLGALFRPGDVLILDKLCHASLIDGAKLSGATLRVFPHHRLDKLRELLVWARTISEAEARVMVVTESIFSMDGDAAPLAEMAALAREHEAWFMVDEAHALGLFGSEGTGLVSQLGLTAQVDLQMGTLSKAVGLSGGFMAGSQAMMDLLLNKARSFIYSTAPPPCLAAAAAWVLGSYFPSPAGQAARRRFWENVNQFTSALGLPAATSGIIPLILGDSQAALAAAAALQDAGFLVPAIRYPTVARNAARLRVTLTAAHTPEQIAALAAACAKLLPSPELG